MAFLLDQQTISILNLVSKVSEGTIDHDSKIVSLSFDYNANKILFKDQKRGLHLFNITTREK